MKKKKAKGNNMNNFFNQMSYELAGDIGAIDNERMVNNEDMIKDINSYNKNKLNKKRYTD